MFVVRAMGMPLHAANVELLGSMSGSWPDNSTVDGEAGKSRRPACVPRGQ